LRVYVAFGNQAQESFLEGHVLAFAYFGAVPARIRYDTLKPAVIRVLRGRDRVEPERLSRYEVTMSRVGPMTNLPARTLGGRCHRPHLSVLLASSRATWQ
jgi:hypothetical protein